MKATVVSCPEDSLSQLKNAGARRLGRVLSTAGVNTDVPLRAKHSTITNSQSFDNL